MQAAMMHGGGGVLLMMLTKFASQETIKKHKITKNAIKAPSLTTISNSKQQHKITKSQAKTTMATNTLLHTTNLLPRSSNFK